MRRPLGRDEDARGMGAPCATARGRTTRQVVSLHPGEQNPGRRGAWVVVGWLR